MLDVLIVGAGISGISAACHLEKRCATKRYAVLEGRDNVGGTWDLFRYPGIRSDSDMHTFGFSFKPWTNPKSISDGESIREYLKEAVAEYGVKDKIRFGHKVVSANWDSMRDVWLVTATNVAGETVEIETRVLFMCSGYYNYAEGYTPDYPGLSNFKGQLIHPQKWPEDLDYSGKKVAVIGSGATAVTIVPNMVDKAAQVTMIQRSPTYMFSRPAKDAVANFLGAVLPSKWAYALTRWKNIYFQNATYKGARKNPEKTKKLLLDSVRKSLGDDYDIDTHFTPRYNPWEQRLCLIPDDDFLSAVKSGSAEVVTDTVDKFVENGVLMSSGRLVEADIVVSATGLNMQFMGGVEFFIDEVKLDLSKKYYYQGMMFSGVPNLIQTFGYINASWTLRADLNSIFVCDLLQEMDRKNASHCVPKLRPEDASMVPQPTISGFNPGYMQRGIHEFPKQGEHAPWHNTQDYLLDRKILKSNLFSDGVLQFGQADCKDSANKAPETNETHETHETKVA